MADEEAALLAATLARSEAEPSGMALTDSGPLPDSTSEDSAPARSALADPAPAELPALDDLVARIPGPVREALDELFRARFTAVRRYPAQLAET